MLYHILASTSDGAVNAQNTPKPRSGMLCMRTKPSCSQPVPVLHSNHLINAHRPTAPCGAPLRAEQCGLCALAGKVC